MAQGLYLSQKMSLQQVLAPQLQQSLALLQAPTLELKALVEQELQQNPVLEEVAAEEIEQKEKPEREGDTTIETRDPAEPPADVTFDPASRIWPFPPILPRTRLLRSCAPSKPFILRELGRGICASVCCCNWNGKAARNLSNIESSASTWKRWQNGAFPSWRGLWAKRLR